MERDILVKSTVQGLKLAQLLTSINNARETLVASEEDAAGLANQQIKFGPGQGCTVRWKTWQWKAL